MVRNEGTLALIPQATNSRRIAAAPYSPKSLFAFSGPTNRQHALLHTSLQRREEVRSPEGRSAQSTLCKGPSPAPSHRCRCTVSSDTRNVLAIDRIDRTASKLLNNHLAVSCVPPSAFFLLIEEAP